MGIEAKEDWLKGERLYIDKPLDMTSFNVVRLIRGEIAKTLEVKAKSVNVGHAGTLDPKATGVLIVCTGKETKNIDNLQGQTKEYVADLYLGATTPSYDTEHEIDKTYSTEHITRDLVDDKIRNFVGTIEQEPPAYSAIKIDGRRAYKMARQGEKVEMKKKTLTIDEIEVLAFELPLLRIRVVCSKGTYIRALARDIGESLGSGAYLTALRRTRIGDVRVEDCVQLDDLLKRLREERNSEKKAHA